MVRAAVRRIVLTGPECTGKTTLAAALAAELGVPLVAESARTYAQEVERALTVDDVERIARLHIAAEDAALGESPSPPPTLVLDTDLVSTIVYGHHYYGFRSDWLEREARARLGSVYLLCSPDIPWVADGVRDRPENRSEMLAEFRAVLDAFGAEAEVVAGFGESRIAAARTALQKHAMAEP